MDPDGAERVGRWQFGEFVLDSGTRELLRNGQPVHLSPKAFHLLELLVACAPNALSKADLQERLWPGTFVVEANLSHLVGELRAALGDDASEPLYIRTVYGFGYAFKQRAEPAGGRAPGTHDLVCVLNWTDGRVALMRGNYVIGRDPGADVVVASSTVSRRHARLYVGDELVTLEDLGSRNGTFVGERRIQGLTPLSDRYEITVGAVPMHVRLYAGAGSTETAQRPPVRPSTETDEGPG